MTHKPLIQPHVVLRICLSLACLFVAHQLLVSQVSARPIPPIEVRTGGNTGGQGSALPGDPPPGTQPGPCDQANVTCEPPSPIKQTCIGGPYTAGPCARTCPYGGSVFSCGGQSATNNGKWYYCAAGICLYQPDEAGGPFSTPLPACTHNYSCTACQFSKRVIDTCIANCLAGAAGNPGNFENLRACFQTCQLPVVDTNINTCSNNSTQLCSFTTTATGSTECSRQGVSSSCSINNCSVGSSCIGGICQASPPLPPPPTPPPSASPGADKPLVMNGSFYANGGFEFRRNLGGSNTTPAEVITWRPDFFVTLQTLPTPFRQILDIPTYNWQEVAP